MANQLKLKGNWNELKGKLKAEYGDITDDDLTYIEGQEEQLIGKLQQKTGVAKEELKDLIFTEEEEKEK